MATTPNWNIVYPVVGTTMTPLANHFANLANSTDTALDTVEGLVTSQNRQFKGTTAALASVTGMVFGDTYQETDGSKILWRYNGSNWVTNEGGMYLIRPTSVAGTGVTVGSDGGVDFAAATSVSVNGVFSSRFRNYLIDFELSAPADMAFIGARLRAAGVDSTANEYRYAIIRSSGASVAGVAASLPLTAEVVSRGAFKWSLFSPALSSVTPSTLDAYFGNQAAAIFAYRNSYVYGAIASFDGFSVVAGSSNITGKCKIYGLA